MSGRIRSHLRSNVIGYLALFFALSGSVAYATHPGGDNTIDSGDIINGQVTEPDIATNSVRSAEILNDSMAGGGLEQQDLQGSSVGGSEIRNNAVASGEVENDSLGSDDLAPDSVTNSEMTDDSVGTAEIAADSITDGEVEDFSLSNADVGAMYAEVQASGFLINSSGGITATHVGTSNSGTYQVDFGRNVSLCAAVATIGSDTTAISDGEVNVADTPGNVEAVTVDTNLSNNTPADRPFRLIVLC